MYAAQKLQQAGESDALARRLLDALIARFTAARERRRKNGRRSELTDALAKYLDDVRSSLEWARGNDPERGAALLGAIGFAWRGVGMDIEGLVRIDEFLALPQTKDDLVRARLLTASAWLRGNAGEHVRARDDAFAAVQAARRSMDVPTMADALREYANDSAAIRRFDDAERALAQAETLTGVPPGLRIELLESRAFVTHQAGSDFASAADAYKRLIQHYRTLGDERAELRNTLNLCEVEHARGCTSRAVELVRDVLPRIVAGPDRRRAAMTLANLSGYLIALGDLDEAAKNAREAIRQYRASDAATPYVAMAIEHLALIAALEGNPARAAVLEGFADDALARAGYAREFTESESHRRVIEMLEKHLTAAERDARMAEGAALPPEAAVALALEDEASDGCAARLER